MILNKKEQSSGGTGEGTKWWGFTEAEVIACNPSMEQISQIYGNEQKEGAKEPIYEGDTRNKDPYVVIEFWLQANTPEKQIFRKRFMLTDKEVESKSGKIQYVNQTGGSAYTDNPKNLQEFFTHYQKADENDPETDWKKKKKINVHDKEYRKAIMGEADLYEFLTKWLRPELFWGEDNDGNYTNILVDKRKMFNNIEKYVETSIRPLIGSTEVKSVVELLTIKTDADGKHYQNTYDTLPSTIKDGKAYKNTISVIRSIAPSGAWHSNPILKKYVDSMQGEYPCSDAYILDTIRKWDPNDKSNPITTSTDAIRHSEESNDIPEDVSKLY